MTTSAYFYSSLILSWNPYFTVPCEEPFNSFFIDTYF